MKYGRRKGFRLALIAGGDEFAADQWQGQRSGQGNSNVRQHDDLVTFVTAALRESTAAG